MITQETKIDKIKRLYAQIDRKHDFMIGLAEKMGKSPKTLRSHWFSKHGFWSVPENHEDEVILEMEKTIGNQESKK